MNLSSIDFPDYNGIGVQILLERRRGQVEKYLLVYYGGAMENDPKKAKAAMAAWMKWFQDMGKAVVDAGNPTAPGKVVSPTGVRAVAGEPVTGYSIIQANNLDAAVALAKSSPQIAAGGKITLYTIQPTM